MNNPPIILVPGFWLGAWAWDEVAADLRAAGHDVTALTLPGLESKDADRSGDHDGRPRRRDRRRDQGEAERRRPRRPQRDRLLRLRGERPGPRADRGDGLRRHRTGRRRARSGLSGRREADGLGVGRRGGEPRRALRGTAGDVPGARGAGAGRRAPRGRRPRRATPAATSRARSSAPAFTAEQYQTYAREDPAPTFLAGIPEIRQRHLDRPADEPLADVVQAARDRRDHRQRREGTGQARASSTATG